MSSGIPTRRAPRPLGKPTQSDENKTAKSALTTARLARAKVAAGQPSTSTVTLSKATISTGDEATSDIAGKRKRDALGEVTNGKGAKAGLPAKRTLDAKNSKSTLSTAATRRRVPLQPKHERGSSKDLPDGIHPGDVAMTLESAGASTSTILIDKSLQHTTRKTIHVKREVKEEVDDLLEPANKKRRTSPEIPSDAEHELLDDLKPKVEVDHLEVITEELSTEVVEEQVVVIKEGENVEGWENLDADDEKDPLMEAEYAGEIFQFLKGIEDSMLPDSQYVENMQPYLKWEMRGIMIDFMIHVHERFRGNQESLFLAVNIMDRFLSLRQVDSVKLQLVGCTALYVALKVEEQFAPSAINMVTVCSNAFSAADLFAAERYMLRIIDWNLSYPSPLNFLRRASKADDYHMGRRILAKYLMEVGTIEHRLVATPPSLLSAAAMWLARLIDNEPEWHPNLEYYSSYSERQLVPIANLMINYVLKPPRHDHLVKKYAGKKYMKSSLYTRQWALERWNSGSRVDLARDLPELKLMALEYQQRWGQEMKEEELEV